MTPTAERERLPVERHGITHKVNIYDAQAGTQEGYITANCYEDGRLGEVFLTGFGKSGSTLEGWVQVAATLFSTALQYGADRDVLIAKLAHTKFPPYGPTDDPEIPYCHSAPDYIMRWLAIRFGSGELRKQLDIEDGGKTA